MITKYLTNPLTIQLKKCTRCNYVKVLVKGNWCRECKNEYECERRNKDENRDKINSKSREKYEQKKKQILLNPVNFNLTDTKTCSICKIQTGYSRISCLVYQQN